MEEILRGRVRAKRFSSINIISQPGGKIMEGKGAEIPEPVVEGKQSKDPVKQKINNSIDSINNQLKTPPEDLNSDTKDALQAVVNSHYEAKNQKGMDKLNTALNNEPHLKTIETWLKTPAETESLALQDLRSTTNTLTTNMNTQLTELTTKNKTAIAWGLNSDQKNKLESIQGTLGRIVDKDDTQQQELEDSAGPSIQAGLERHLLDEETKQRAAGLDSTLDYYKKTEEQFDDLINLKELKQQATNVTAEKNKVASVIGIDPPDVGKMSQFKKVLAKSSPADQKYWEDYMEKKNAQINHPEAKKSSMFGSFKKSIARTVKPGSKIDKLNTFLDKRIESTCNDISKNNPKLIEDVKNASVNDLKDIKEKSGCLKTISNMRKKCNEIKQTEFTTVEKILAFFGWKSKKQKLVDAIKKYEPELNQMNLNSVKKETHGKVLADLSQKANKIDALETSKSAFENSEKKWSSLSPSRKSLPDLVDSSPQNNNNRQRP